MGKSVSGLLFHESVSANALKEERAKNCPFVAGVATPFRELSIQTIVFAAEVTILRSALYVLDDIVDQFVGGRVGE